MTPDDLVKDYRAAFLRHLARRDEDGLAHGYELGRRALREGTSLLEVVRVHHLVLAEVARSDRDDPGETALAASQFLLEVLASFEMVVALGTRARSPEAGH
jgi:hypothetical protein